MILPSDLESVMKRQGKPGSWVLSVYLDTDQSRMANRNREFESTLKTLLRSVGEKIGTGHEHDSFEADSNRVLQFVSSCRPNARSLVFFCDESEGFFWDRSLNVPMGNEVHWGEAPYFKPILEAFDEFERYGVILTDKRQARVFTVFLGEIEEHCEALALAAVKHFRGAGSDHMRSQMNFQRKSELHALWHLKRVAGLMNRMADARGFERLVLAGPADTTHMLYRLLPDRLQSRVVASMALSLDASPQEVLEATLKVEQKVERKIELKLVEELVVSAAKQAGAVTGLIKTLQAMQRSQIWKLVYVDGFVCSGNLCPGCKRLYADQRSSCGHCNLPVQMLDDLLEQIVQRVVGAGGKAEQVCGEAAEQLTEVGGIGAMLRT